MSRSILLAVLLLLSSIGLQAQSFSGLWVGKLTQNLDPPFNEYRMRLDLRQKDDIVTGVSHIHLPDSLEIFAEMEFRGVVKGNVLYFMEPGMLDGHHFDEWDWCLKRGKLTLEDMGGIMRMEGMWEGKIEEMRCESGGIVVEQADFRPDPLARDKGEERKNVEAKNSVEVKNPPVVEQKKAPAVAQQQDPEPIVEQEKNYGDLDGRPITRQAEVPVSKTDITAYIWDANKEDGDVVSLQYNGEWLLRDFTLRNAKKAIQLKLSSNGDNRLILYAENLGSIPPNTCALTFHDGERIRTLSLVSDKVSCGALKFVVKE